jgi:hypothetical protein
MSLETFSRFSLCLARFTFLSLMFFACYEYMFCVRFYKKKLWIRTISVLFFWNFLCEFWWAFLSFFVHSREFFSLVVDFSLLVCWNLKLRRNFVFTQNLNFYLRMSLKNENENTSRWIIFWTKDNSPKHLDLTWCPLI